MSQQSCIFHLYTQTMSKYPQFFQMHTPTHSILQQNIHISSTCTHEKRIQDVLNTFFSSIWFSVWKVLNWKENKISKLSCMMSIKRASNGAPNTVKHKVRLKTWCALTVTAASSCTQAHTTSPSSRESEDYVQPSFIHPFLTQAPSHLLTITLLTSMLSHYLLRMTPSAIT